ncbi:MalY/PatB family protein [Natranaerobius trueperi]|uniref:cysteine-S-conjugate beta-lyase n=1 Tax=Natranaerobius trueperi TaxID=759412 RepID=A0A226BXD2_9FIRM|nr:MalY/PatB family protein [Natranaerobius trueperi]OWZ82800.1 cystathionine beta-lyase [Natranaerobius trueperi]
MTKVEFDKVIDRYNTNSYKWDEAKKFFGEKNVIPMWVADMDFESPKQVQEVLTKRAKHGVYGYAGDYEEYYKSITQWFLNRFGISIEKEWISITPGVVPALNMIIRTFTNPGDKVVLQSPVYPPFFDAIRKNGCHVANNVLKRSSNKYYIDFDDLEIKLSDSRAKLLLLCSPHNPVGRVWSREELVKIAKLCKKHGVLIVSDEIHSDLTFINEQHISFLQIATEEKVPTILCTSAAKTFNIAGLQISNVIIPDEFIREEFKNTLKANGISKPNIFGLTAQTACYKYGEPWLDNLRHYLTDNYLYLEDYIQKNIPQIKVTKSEGTFLAWLDIRETSMSSNKIYTKLIKEGKVALLPGNRFGEGGEGFLRINFGCPRELLDRGLKRISKVLT